MKLETVNEAIRKIKPGSSVMIGGFIGIGRPQILIEALANTDIFGLTLISNDTDFENQGVGKLITNNQVTKVIASHIGTNPETGRKLSKGEIVVELVPQGTLVERIRSKGSGLGGILTPTGIGTMVEHGKKKFEINSVEYLLETALGADFALIKAQKADSSGNLVFRRSSRNFHPVMATAADYVIAEVEEYVETGEIDPDEVMLPGIFVDAIVQRGV